MDILLETKRLRLRRFTAADADHLFALDNDPEVMRFINGGTPASRAAIEAHILPAFMRYPHDDTGFGRWAAVDKQSGEFLGWFSFHPSDNTPGEVILGYRFRRAVWGQGYATEGAHALIEQGFRNWGVQRVVATTYEDNLASQRVMAKLGMTLARRFRLTEADILKTDTHHVTETELWDGDDLAYAIDRNTWLAQNNPG